jgi:hypothetical protein
MLGRATTASKQEAPVWCVRRPLQAVASIRHDCPWITLRSSLRRLARTTPTPIKHKLKDCSMMMNFMASGSLARGMEVNEVLDEGNTTPFLREDAVMMIYDWCPSLGMRCASNPSLGTLARYSWGCGDVRTQVFPYLCTLTYVEI